MGQTPDTLPVPHLKDTIPQPLGPKDLLEQLDKEPNWKPIEFDYPVFPSDYPPPFPQGLADSVVSRAYAPQEDDPLELLGDALIDAAMYLSTLSALRKNRIQEIIGDVRNWEALEARGVSLGKDYPPSLPVEVIESEFLTAALTDTGCRIHWGNDVRSDEGYRALGLHVYRAIATILPIQTRPCTTRADWDMSLESETRTILTGCPLVARLALVYEVHRHLRIVRREGDDTYWISAGECAKAFYALVGLVFVERGWNIVLDWIRGLLSPWIAAVATGKLLGHAGAQSRHLARLEQQATAETRRAARAAQAEKHRSRASHDKSRGRLR
ncbi:hypothetical protein FB45DRAFT_1042040 [Roridomyces roridus]|uniref:RNase III domain-containing protein n=1 Tax=Roridomyces roridus TaxID=1738132 RepID=A0AAD7AZJ1_9AGAR|nr:hypothetical protein FB45DRAFT_1042040 [Roridomyces roridus]